MEDKLRLYLWWKAKFAEDKQDRKVPSAVTRGGNHSDNVATGSGGGGSGRGNGTAQKGEGELSEALKKKDKERQTRTANRRRVRGGAPVQSASSSRDGASIAGTSGGDARTSDEGQTIVEL